MHASNSLMGGILPSIKPYVIARADFENLLPVYKKMALALVQTGKVLIVGYSQPSTESSASVASTVPSPHQGGIASSRRHQPSTQRGSISGGKGDGFPPIVDPQGR